MLAIDSMRPLCTYLLSFLILAAMVSAAPAGYNDPLDISFAHTEGLGTDRGDITIMVVDDAIWGEAHYSRVH